ncbi:MAG: anti-sigma factor [Sedimentitalea sp.]|uniref:anti-sigma factor n=1 Tax=Sedimentitalea sp. TaxID=2048915 RepID=UPI00326412E9
MTSELSSEERELLAAEYALGLLTGADLTQARQMETTDSEFVRLVTDWEIRLAALTNDLTNETPSPSVKKALLAEVFPQRMRQPFFKRLWAWQAGVAFGLLMLAAVIAFDFRTPDQTTGPLYAAEITADAGDFRVVAVVDKSTDEMFLTRTLGSAPEGRILQVWAHGEGEPTISVGLWPEGDTIRLPMPEAIAAVEGILTIGVSEEPPGGSTTGLPSGRIFGTVNIPDVFGQL